MALVSLLLYKLKSLPWIAFTNETTAPALEWIAISVAILAVEHTDASVVSWRIDFYLKAHYSAGVKSYLLYFHRGWNDNSSYAHVSIHAISWHLFHVIHLPLCTSTIRGEIKLLFIILFLCLLLVELHLKQHTGILIVVSGNDDQQKLLNVATE